MTSTMRNRNIRRALAAPLLLLLAGCGSLIGPSGAPPQIYVLNPAYAPVDAPTVSWQLSVTHPDAADVYDTARLAIERNGIMDYYANAQWTDQTEPLIQRVLVEGFEKSGHIAAVGRDREGLHADNLLQIEVRDFTARYQGDSGVPTVSVELVAKLVTPDRHMVIGVLDAHHTAVATANSIPAAVAAFNTATGQTVDEIVAWTLKTGSASEPADGTPPAPVRSRHRHRRHR